MSAVSKKRKKPETIEVSGFFGGDEWARTIDLMRVKHAL